MINNIQLNNEQRQRFKEDGFVVIEKLLNDHTISLVRDRFEPLFNGEFETGLQPDEWNWKAGRDENDLTRQICNAWKSDSIVQSIVLSETVGRLCAQLMQWPGARINQDNVIWKPPGAKALGFHQDDSFQDWINPPSMMTCWITLDDTQADHGTIEYVRGSHQWQVSKPISQFHAPDDPQLELREAAAQANAKLDIVPIVVAAGPAVLHHGRTWHGSNANSGDTNRRSVVAHCMSSAACYSSKSVSPVYSRYKKHGSNEMDESFFPILYTDDGYRSPWL